MNEKRAAEMPRCGRRGKPKAGFPSPPTSPWKSLARFPHSRSPGHYRHGKVEIQKQDSHFPTAHSSLSNHKRKEISTPTCYPRLQAHLKIRKRYGYMGIQISVSMARSISAGFAVASDDDVGADSQSAVLVPKIETR